MRKSRLTILMQTAVLLLLSLNMATAMADRKGHGFKGHHGHQRHYDTRHHHNRYYPSVGLFVNIIPSGHHVVRYRNDPYYFHSGVWYRPSGARFVVVTPPIGLAVSVLPSFYTTVWVGGTPYYYADGVYYAWRSEHRDYVVIDAPRESEVVALPAEVSPQFIYPNHGQDEQQQAKDRYECHRWSVSQTGFDPTLPSDTATAQNVSQRDDYQRATKACLEGRGYSVR
jgi:Family of unknown function (DUF6515)